MSMATIEKLRAVNGQPQVSEPANEAATGESLGEQLDAIYADIDYLTQKFPRHNIRSLVDYALSLQAKVQEQHARPATGQGTAQDHGLIPAAVFASMATLTQDACDKADVGIVEVDDNGIIKIYNRYESELAGVAKEVAIGRNFFQDVAPCTNNRLFFGRFKSGIESSLLDSGFNYTFTYKMKPTPVSIHLYRDASSQRNFIFVKRR